MNKVVVRNAGKELTASASPETGAFEHKFNLKEHGGEPTNFLNTLPAIEGDVFVVSGQFGTPQRTVPHIPVDVIDRVVPYVLERNREVGQSGVMEVFIKPKGDLGRDASGSYPKGSFFNISATWSQGATSFHEMRMNEGEKLKQFLEQQSRSRLGNTGHPTSIAQTAKPEISG